MYLVLFVFSKSFSHLFALLLYVWILILAFPILSTALYENHIFKSQEILWYELEIYRLSVIHS